MSYHPGFGLPRHCRSHPRPQKRSGCSCPQAHPGDEAYAMGLADRLVPQDRCAGRAGDGGRLAKRARLQYRRRARRSTPISFRVPRRDRARDVRAAGAARIERLQGRVRCGFDRRDRRLPARELAVSVPLTLTLIPANAGRETIDLLIGNVLAPSWGEGRGEGMKFKPPRASNLLQLRGAPSARQAVI